MLKITYCISCILFSCFFAYSCTDEPEDNLPEEKDSEISVMSFNIRTATSDDTGERSWDYRKEGCIVMIDSLCPDFIGMQEVRPVQKSFFDSNLSKYKSVGIARDGSGESTEYNPIYYKTDIFTLLESSTFWLSDTPDFMSKGWDGANYRICTWAKFKINTTGQQIYYFNTHIDHAGATAQKQGLLLIENKINEIAISQGDSVVFLTGDFNMTPTNQNIVDFKNSINNVRDQFTSSEYYSTMTTNGWGTGGNIIDYVWYLNATPLSYEVINSPYDGVVYLSDHFPVLSNVSL